MHLHSDTNDEAIYYRSKLLTYLKRCCKVGDFTLSSGKKSDFYVDCREILLQHEVMTMLGKYVACSDNKPWFGSVAGVTSGADPVICSIVMSYAKGGNGLFIRKTAKDHGTKRMIEGTIPSDKSALVVDDVLTTGGSIEHACDTLIQAGLTVSGIFVVVDREENNAVVDLERRYGVHVCSLATKSEIKGTI